MENEITRHRITSFQFVEHSLMMGCVAAKDKMTRRNGHASNRETCSCGAFAQQIGIAVHRPVDDSAVSGTGADGT